MKRRDAVALIETALNEPPGSLGEDSELRSLRGWDSVGKLSVMAALDGSLGIIPRPQGLARAARVADLLDLVKEALE